MHVNVYVGDNIFTQDQLHKINASFKYFPKNLWFQLIL